MYSREKELNFSTFCVEITTNDHYAMQCHRKIVINNLKSTHVYNSCTFQSSILEVHCEICFNHNDKFEECSINSNATSAKTNEEAKKRNSTRLDNNVLHTLFIRWMFKLRPLMFLSNNPSIS